MKGRQRHLLPRHQQYLTTLPRHTEPSKSLKGRHIRPWRRPRHKSILCRCTDLHHVSSSGRTNDTRASRKGARVSRSTGHEVPSCKHSRWSSSRATRRCHFRSDRRAFLAFMHFLRPTLHSPKVKACWLVWLGSGVVLEECSGLLVLRRARNELPSCQAVNKKWLVCFSES